MSIKTKIILPLIAVLSILSFGGCSPKTAASSANNTVTNNSSNQTNEVKSINITVSAAASLKDAMEAVQKEYAKDKPNVKLTYNFGSSGSLEQQIEQGAPADLFISAATKQIDDLKAKSLIQEDTAVTFLANKVVLVVPKDYANKLDFSGLAEDKIKKIAIGEPKSVPAGQYATEIFKNINITDKVQNKLVQGKDVREVLTWVETGNAEAGIVYETDAKISDKVKIAAYAPDNSHTPVVYPMAAIKATKNLEEVKAFQKYLQEDKAKKIFQGFGFSFVNK